MTYAKRTLQYLREARENDLLLFNAGTPAVYQGEGGDSKVYKVHGSLFEVDAHYEVLNSLGYGAYGVVCTAVDLRLAPDDALYDEAFARGEEAGQVVLRERRDHGEDTADEPGEATRNAATTAAQTLYRVRHFLPRRQGDAAADETQPLYVPTLHFEPYRRRRLLRGGRSPFVAIKKVAKLFQDLVDARRVLREIKALRYLGGHPNIIRLLDVTCPVTDAHAAFDDIYVVTELMDTDLSVMLKSSYVLNEEQTRYMCYQMIKALAYVHSSDIIHRDMKPGNVLINGDCTVKLCDFGLSRGGVPLRRQTPATTIASSAGGGMPFDAYCFHDSTGGVLGAPRAGSSTLSHEPRGGTVGDKTCCDDTPVYSLTEYVVTRYYRAPELLVMGRYNHAVDMWAVGCIVAEMLLRRPLFVGTNYLTQLALILETPGLRGVPACTGDVDSLFDGGEEGKRFVKQLLFDGQPTTPRQDGRGAGRDTTASEALLGEALFGVEGAPAHMVRLLAGLLHVDPHRRLTAVQALQEPYFAPLYRPNDVILHRHDLPTSSYRTELSEEEAQGGFYVVEDAPRPFLWEFDHRITRRSNLQMLFREEIEHFSEVKRQWRERQLREGQ